VGILPACLQNSAKTPLRTSSGQQVEGAAVDACPVLAAFPAIVSPTGRGDPERVRVRPQVEFGGPDAGQVRQPERRERSAVRVLPERCSGALRQPEQPEPSERPNGQPAKPGTVAADCGRPPAPRPSPRPSSNARRAIAYCLLV